MDSIFHLLIENSVNQTVALDGSLALECLRNNFNPAHVHVSLCNYILQVSMRQ